MPSSNIEIRTGKRWAPLSRGTSRVFESRTLEMRGLNPYEELSLGPVFFMADKDGRLVLCPVRDENLCGHLGLIEIRRDSDALIGEIEVLPDKMSASAFGVLRTELERIWAGLIFDPEGVSSLRGQLPAPQELWRSIETPVRDIAAAPHTVLGSAVGVRRMEHVRRPSELTPALLRAQSRQRPGLSYVLSRDTNTPENTLVAETLRRLVSYARRHSSGSDVATRATRMLREHPFASCGSLRGGIDAARLLALQDDRYRRVERVLRILNRPEAHATEGPGEVRLGVRGIIRLYEYWVFLQVLVSARRLYGPPLDPGFAVLGCQTSNGKVRLALDEGTTVRFPGEVRIAFEPQIHASGGSWQGLENVPHPNRNLAQRLIAPDVVVLRRTTRPSAVVFDAKYVGLRWVETRAAELHAKYSRIRLHGKPVVRNVLAAHPHQGVDDLWSGYGSVPMVPGETPNIERLLP